MLRYSTPGDGTNPRQAAVPLFYLPSGKMDVEIVGSVLVTTFIERKSLGKVNLEVLFPYVDSIFALHLDQS
jgi:hypothetical protein